MNRDDTLSAAALYREFVHLRPFAETVLGRRQDHAVTNNGQCNDFVSLRQFDATNTGSTAAHWPDVILLEANGLAMTRDQHDLLLTVRDSDVHQFVIVPQVNRDDAA